ncbi:polysaccharide pyruvyl transferase family protein [Bacillus sp. JCM 19041]|uniref:polysaccharide pyruvyl transferase family protein n=1 Tax=Bacillus sp. JCM 19041 TaxID=1460637 RepID=UPI0006D2A6D5
MKVALHGGYITENFGDELLLVLHERWVNKNQEHKIYMPYASKEYFDQVNAEGVKGEKAIGEAEKLIYIGGGYLGETNHDRWRWGFRFIKRKHHFPAESFQKSNKPFAIIGAGAGPISNVWTRNKVVKMCNKADTVAVRDEQSKEYLNKYGVDPKKIIVTADTVLSLANEDVPSIAREEVAEIFKQEKRKLFVVHIGIHEGDKAYSRQAKLLIKSIAAFFNENEHFVPVLLEDKRKATEQQDSNEKIIRQLKGDYYRFVHKDVWTTCALLEHVDKVVTTKLHVGITAYSLGTSAFSFAAHQKTRRFYQQIDRSECCLDISEIGKEEDISKRLFEFSRRIEVLNEREISIREELRGKALVNKELTERYLKIEAGKEAL